MLALEGVVQTDNEGVDGSCKNLSLRQDALYFVSLDHVVLLHNFHCEKFLSLFDTNKKHLSNGAFTKLTDLLEIGQANRELEARSNRGENHVQSDD